MPTTYDTTDRYGLRALLGANNVSDVDAGFMALRDDISTKMVAGYQGDISTRPPSSPGTPGIAIQIFRATNNGAVYLDFGTGWDQVTTAFLNDPRDSPIGAIIPYAGASDPPGGKWLLADGRLIDQTVYAACFAALGHIYNGGMDPGSNQFRIPDLRGRVPLGSDNMGTAQGNAGHIPNSAWVRGESGGAELSTLQSHTHTGGTPNHTHANGSYQIAAHGHTFTTNNNSAAAQRDQSGSTAATAADPHVHTGTTSNAAAAGVTGNSGSNNESLTFTTGGPNSSPTVTNLQPHQTVFYIVRIA